jgi:apolipoprotein N-acyltransferase
LELQCQRRPANRRDGQKACWSSLYWLSYSGLGEVWVGLFGNYLGILSKSMPPSAATAIVGALYSLGGLALLITRRTWGAIFSLIFIGSEVLGRVYLVAVGIAPSKGGDLLKIILGGVIAIGSMLYIGLGSFPAGPRRR